VFVQVTEHYGRGLPVRRKRTGRATANAAAALPDFDLRDLIDGAVLLASTANAVMQLALPAIGHGVLESKVESVQVMRHPFRRIRRMRNCLVQQRPTVTPRPVRAI
jgi:uncharacterized protein (DUF2236 family)